MVKQLALFMMLVAFLVGCGPSVTRVKQYPYAVVSAGSSLDSSLFVKYSKHTGQTWIHSSKEGWIPIPDDEVLPPSIYTINLITMGGYHYSAIRIDTATGRSWSAINNKWVELGTRNHE